MLLLRNIGTLVQTGDRLPARRDGSDMLRLDCLPNAFVLIDGERIADWGSMERCPERADEVVDAGGGMVLPSWCDSHTHLVFAAWREGEFIDRCQGVSYEEIARKGGGILNSARRLHQMPEEQLLEAAWLRLQEVAKQGTGAIEIKSGYGLSVEGELKMLRVIRRLRECSPLPIRATFLGAHALPLEYRERREDYLRLIENDMLPRIADQGLADYIDVFCEKGFFSVAETERLLEAGARYGLPAKVHVNQFNALGGIEACVRHGARSVDHLEVVSEEDIQALRGASTIATLLPSASFFLHMHYPPARRMLEAGLPLALATDYNPGTSPSGKMSFVLTLACIYMQMLPEEALNAATLNGAYAMDWSDQMGSISRGKLANLFITKPIPSLAYLPYAFGSDCIERCMVRGKWL